ncbi:SGNH/GDSL hydrolase family protein [Blastococcus sp. SYSU DS0753]
MSRRRTIAITGGIVGLALVLSVLIPGSPTRVVARGAVHAQCVTWVGDEGSRSLAVYGDSISRADSEPRFGFHGGRSWYSHLVCSDEFTDGANAAVAGETAAEVLGRLEADAPRVDVLVIQAGTNDLRLGVPTRETVANLRRAVRLGQEAAGTVLLATVQPWTDTDATALNAAVRRLADRTGVELVDFAGVLGDRDLTRDGVHPTEAGARALADLVAEAVT